MKMNVMIVDDNEADRHLAARAFAESGCAARIVEFDDGDGALPVRAEPARFERVMGECPPLTVVLPDIDMSRM